MIEGQVINIMDLPSKGFPYNKNIEIYVKPMTYKEELAMTKYRWVISKAGYYENLLDSIEVKGEFDKRNLLFADMQMLDLIRRLYSFELTEKIIVKDFICPFCKTPLNASFYLKDLEFSDIEENAFQKEFEFSDGLKIKSSPIVVNDYIDISRQYLTNVKFEEDGSVDTTNFILAARVKSVIEVIDRIYKNNDEKEKFLFEYFSDLWKAKDKSILDEMDKVQTSICLPFEVECSKCKKESEVFLEPSMRFQQQ